MMFWIGVLVAWLAAAFVVTFVLCSAISIAERKLGE